MTLPPSFHAEIQGPVDGNVNIVQAGVLKADTVTISAPAKELLGHLEQAQQHLLLSRRTEERTAVLVAVLHEALIRAFQLIGRLTAARDERLPEAQEKHRRTEGQLDRAEADHLRAMALCHTLGRRVRALQDRLLTEEPPAAAQLRGANEPSPGTTDILDDLTMGLDRIEQLLTAEEETLAKITGDAQAAQVKLVGEGEQAIGSKLVGESGQPTGPKWARDNEQPLESNPLETLETARSLPVARPTAPTPDEAAQAAKWRDIALDTSISVKHRLKAASELVYSSEYHIEAAIGLRLIIADSSLPGSEHMSAIGWLRRLGPEFRLEAIALLDQRMKRHPNPLDRVWACELLSDLDPDNRGDYVSYLREAATTSESATVRRVAARKWWKLVPRDRAVVVETLRETAESDDVTESAAHEARQLIEEIETDPYYTEESDTP